MSTDVSEMDFDFATGSAEIKKEQDKNRPVFADQLNRPQFLSFTQDDPRHIVRFLDDDQNGENDTRRNLWIGVQEHSFVKTVPKPESFTSDNWQGQMGGVCRRDRAFKRFYSGCYICDNQLPKANSSKGEFAAPSQRIYARVVLREKVKWTEDDAKAGLCPAEKVGKAKGIEDVLREIPEIGSDGKSTGNKLWVPDVRLIAAGRKNFFQHMIGHAQNNLDENDVYTVLDCDWRITRTGFGTNDTAYTINMVPGSDQLGAPPEFATDDFPCWTPRNPAVLKFYEDQIPWTLRGHLARMASDEHHERWFVPGGWDKHERKKKESAEASGAAAKGKGTIEDDDEDAPAATSPADARPAVSSQDASGEADTPAPASQGASAIEEDGEDDTPPARSRLQGYRDRMSAGDPPERPRQSSAIEEDDEEMQRI